MNYSISVYIYIYIYVCVCVCVCMCICVHVNVYGNISLVSLFNGISTLYRLFNAKAILREER